MGLMVGCTGGSPPGHQRGTTISGRGTVTQGFRAVAADEDVSLILSAPAPDEAAYAALRQVTDLGVIVTAPASIEAQAGSEVAVGTFTLTRTYPAPLPQGVRASFAYYDIGLDGWVEVPSELSPDRVVLTATVSHLSLWSDFVAGAEGARQQFLDAAGRSAAVVKDITDAAVEGATSFAQSVADGMAEGAETMYYHVGKIFDVRVDAPACDGATPSWATSVVFIERDRNNPILWCAGSDPKNRDLLVIKARVNRGYGYLVHTASDPAWRWNDTFADGTVRPLVEAVVDVDAVVASHVTQLMGEGEFVGPGKEIALGFTEEQARKAEFEPLVKVEPPAPGAFVVSLIVRQMVSAGLDLEDGMLAALIGYGKCASQVQAIDGLSGTIGSAQQCLTAGAESTAKLLATALVKKGKDPKLAGQLAGKLVGRVVVYLGLIGPVWVTLNWTADSMLADDAFTAVVFVRPSPAMTSARLRSVRVPSLCDHPAGQLKGGVIPGNGNNGEVRLDEQRSRIGTLVPGQPAGAAAVFNCSQGGIGWPEHVLFYDHQGTLVGHLDAGGVGESPGRQVVAGATIDQGRVTVTIDAVPLSGDNELWGSGAAEAIYAWDASSSTMKRQKLTISEPDGVARKVADALQRRDRTAAAALLPAATVKDLMPTGDVRVEFGSCIGSYDVPFGAQVAYGQRGCVITFIDDGAEEPRHDYLLAMARTGLAWRVTGAISVVG